MSEANTIARPYAQAAFDEAQKLRDLKGWSATLLRLAEVMSNPEVQSAVGNPRLSKTKIEPIILELLLPAQLQN